MNAPQPLITWPQAVSSWGVEEEDAAIACIRSGRLTMGSKVREFEHAFAKHVGSTHAVMVNSGSSANLIAVAAMFHAGKFRAGDQAIVPAIAWATTYAPLQQYGLRLKVVDVELDSLNMNCTLVEKALTRRTRLIVGVNLLGNPADLPWLRRVADAEGLVFLEDNCESMGATVDDKSGVRHCGTFGDIGTFSFFFSHHLNTVEGGMLVTDDEELADNARCLRAHGWTRDVSAGSPLRRPTTDFSRDYDFALPGYNVRPTEIMAAIGLEQLKRLPVMAEQRRQNAYRFDALLPGGWIRQRRQPGAVPFALTAIAPSADKRAEMIESLRSVGAECRPIAGGCFTMQRVAAHYDYEVVGDLRNALWAHDCGLMVGNHPVSLEPQIDALRQALG